MYTQIRTGPGNTAGFVGVLWEWQEEEERRNLFSVMLSAFTATSLSRQLVFLMAP